MKLISERGEFGSFIELRHAFKEAHTDCEFHRLVSEVAGEGEWDEAKLHASDVGACHRQAMYRITGAPKVPKAAMTEASEGQMHAVGYFLHYWTYAAARWAGISEGCEVQLMDGTWSGSADLLFRPDYRAERIVGYDHKSQRAAAFKNEFKAQWPKEANCLQVASYAEKAGLSEWLIEYSDRDGSNPPVSCLVDVTPWIPLAAAERGVLEAERERVLADPADLPPCPTEAFKAHRTKVRGQEFMELDSVSLDCDWQCVDEATPILTDKGYVAAFDICPGDKVLTRDGYHTVNAVRVKEPEQKVYVVKPYYGEPLTVTEDHRILVGTYTNPTHQASRQANRTWKTPSELAQWDELMTPKMYLSYRTEECEPADPVSPAAARLLGWWMAEGNYGYKRPDGGYYRIGFTLNVNESELATAILADCKEVFGDVSISTKVLTHPGGTHSLGVVVYARDAADFIQRWTQGGYAGDKAFRDEVMTWPVSLQRHLLGAMWDGDGCVTADTRTQTAVYDYSTISHRLALQVQELCHRQGRLASLVHGINRGGGYGGSDCYHVRYRPDAAASFGKLIKPGLIEVPVQYVREIDEYDRVVVDISVDGKPEFVTSSGIVHNCGYCPYLSTYPPRNKYDKFPPLRPDSLCKPPWHKPITVAWREKGNWRYEDEHYDAVLAFLATQAKRVPILSEEVVT
jgi:hypothetical protein